MLPFLIIIAQKAGGGGGGGGSTTPTFLLQFTTATLSTVDPSRSNGTPK